MVGGLPRLRYIFGSPLCKISKAYLDKSAMTGKYINFNCSLLIVIKVTAFMSQVTPPYLLSYIYLSQVTPT